MAITMMHNVLYIIVVLKASSTQCQRQVLHIVNATVELSNT